MPNKQDSIDTLRAALEASENRFQSFAKIASIGIFQTDIDGFVTYHNEMWSFINNTVDSVGFVWHNNIIEIDRTAICDRWHNDRGRFSCCSYEFRFNRDGDDVWTLCQILSEKNSAGIITGYVGALTDITVQKEHRQQIDKLAHYDPLTSLANRQLFRDRLERGIRNIHNRSGRLAILNIDTDNFKRINDSLGHDAGDKLLTIIAQRLNKGVRDIDTVARFGGDDFYILIHHLDSDNQLTQLVHSLSHIISEPIDLNGQRILMTASMGIAIAPDDANETHSLMKCAELAMYESKAKGRNSFQFFAPTMNSRALERLALEHDLRNAIETNQFYLCYQPKFCINTGEIFGCEALIRWHHPERGEVRPDEFISIAEQTGLIIPIGKYVLQKACLDLKELQNNQIASSHFTVAVNLSVKQFKTLALLHTVIATLYEQGISGECIDLEITESIIMENLDQAIEMLTCLKSYGVRISIDDFGTGYSSLGYLKRLPVDTVKIDRSFIRDLPDDKEGMGIVGAIIAMSHKLGLTVVAEGIETEAQLQVLKDMDCDYGQGYLVSKPLILKDLEDKLLQNFAAQSTHYATSSLQQISLQ